MTKIYSFCLRIHRQLIYSFYGVVHEKPLVGLGSNSSLFGLSNIPVNCILNPFQDEI
jgi:hypothetical protein